MKINCEVIGDLLPLYAENMASKKSRELVEEHIATCESCKQALLQISEPYFEIEHNVDSAKKFQKAVKKHLATVVAITAFVTVAAIGLIEGLFFLQPGDEMGYAIFYFYLFMPLAALVCTGILGAKKGKIKWFAPFLFGVIGGLLPWAVFHSTNLIFVFFAFIPSLIGVLSGNIILYVRSKKQKVYK